MSHGEAAERTRKEGDKERASAEEGGERRC